MRRRLSFRSAAVGAALVVISACTSGESRQTDEPAATEEAGPKELTPERTRFTWQGELLYQGTATYDADLEELRSDGETVAFTSELDEDYWAGHPGSVHVAIRWNEPGELEHHFTGHLFSLYVLDAEREIIASSVGVRTDSSTSMSVDIGRPPAGRYEIVVAPNRSQGSTYEGIVYVKPARRGPNMPDLVPRQATNFSFRVPQRSGAIGPDSPSCLDIEKASEPDIERCLRFDAVIGNVGTGPFITESDITAAVRDGPRTPNEEEYQGDAVQVLEGTDGEDRPVGTGRWVIDREHQHTHLADLAAFELFRVTAGKRGRRVVSDVKIGFCPWDLIDDRYGKPNSVARRFPAQSCEVPDDAENEPVILTIGVSAGWADVYPSRRPIQYLDATDLRGGTYDVVITVDPNEWYEEADDSNNVAATRIRVRGNSLTCVPEPYGCPRHFSPTS